ncbi:MAG: 50S ribosomal protein L24 [Parachlamydiales bacterium]
MSKWLATGDRVVVTCGNEKGKSGKILRRRGARAVIEGLNMRKKAVRPTEANPKGGILEFEAPIHASNLRPCNAEGKAVKLRVRLNEKGKKELVYRDGSKDKVYRVLHKGSR